MKKIILFVIFIGVIGTAFSQQTNYDVTAGDGNGIRFWGDNAYKIHMGNSAEYHFGPVTDYSIKTNMSSYHSGRGWTWGVMNQTPVVAINMQGHTQIAGNFNAGGMIGINGTPVVNTANNANDIYINSRVIRNESTANQDGMYINYNSNGSTNAHLRFFANGTNQRMHIDAGSGNVGIGTMTPGTKLTVHGAGGGNVDFAVNGRIKTGDSSNSGGVVVNGDATMFMGQYNAYAMGWYNGGSWRMTMDDTGKVGIGTTNPDQLLTVNGTIHSKEVKVDLAVAAPDYVFEKDYKLPSLSEIKIYINHNKHLPEVPSAKDMEANGIQLGEMNMLLLKKIEELTLHVIQQNERIEKQDLLFKNLYIELENLKAMENKTK